VEASASSSLSRQRLIFLSAVVTYLPFFGILSAAGYGVLSWITNAWQMLAVVGIFLACTFIWAVAYLLFKRGKYQETVIVLLITITLIFPGIALFWSGTGVAVFLIIGAWVVTGVFVFYGTQPTNKRYLTAIGCLLSTAAIIWIESNQPIVRLNVTDLVLLRWLIPVITFPVGSLLLVLVTRTYLGGRIFGRMLASFLLVVFIPLLTISTTWTIRSLEIDRQNAISTLENTSARKSDAINLWIAEAQIVLYSIPHEAKTDEVIQSLLQTVASHQALGPEGDALTERFKEILAQTSRLEEIFLLDPHGVVIAASVPERLNRRYADQEFFLQGKATLFVTPPFFFQDTGEMSIVFSRPVLNNKGQTVGVLAGRANLRALTQIVSLRAGLGKTGKSLLISSKYYYLNGVIVGTPTIQINTTAVVRAITSKGNGSLLYPDQNNIAVVGSYRWIPALQVAVITEIDQSEAFGRVQSILWVNAVIAIMAAVLAITGAVVTVRSISVPVGVLVETADQVASGNLNARAVIEHEDELGLLGKTLNNMTTQMQGLVTNLEGRVAERTRDLERRTTEIRTAAQIARDASAAGNMNELLNRSARLIRERFGFYHVGIFIIDAKNEFAVLSAAGGEAGQLMLASKHKLKVGEVGIVGFVAKMGQPRVALDTGEDAIYFRNPLLPYTHSEMALPLKISERVIGVLDVQSEKISAFDLEDVETLQIMADQIAVAIERTRLLQELEQALARMEITTQEYTGRSWHEFSKHVRGHQGYRYQGVNLDPLIAAPSGSDEAIMKGTIVLQDDARKDASVLAVPIKLRGQTLGVLNLRFNSSNISPQTITVVEEAADRLALALESARLVADAQERARQERLISDVSSRTRETLDIDTVLRTAVRELQLALNLKEAEVRLEPPGQEQSPANKV